MSFIAKNPLIIPVVNENTLVPPEGTRGFFLKEDGWYKVSPDGTTSKVNSNTSSGSFIDLEISASLQKQTVETIAASLPELDYLEVGMYRLHSNVYQSHEYAFCIVTYTNTSFDKSQTLFLDNGIYTRNGMCSPLFAEWQPWTKLVTSEDIANKLDAGNCHTYVSEVALFDVMNLGQELAFWDKDGNDAVRILIQNYLERGSLNPITSGAVYDAVEEVSVIAKGRATGYVFNSFSDMVAWLQSEQSKGELQQGDNIYIKDTGVPDYWVSRVLNDPDPETGYYYEISELETQKVDLDEYVKNTDYAGVGKTGVVAVSGSFGVLTSSDGRLYLVKASNTDIDNKTDNYRPIVPSNLDYAVQSCTNQDLDAELTEEQLKLPPSTKVVKDSVETFNQFREEVETSAAEFWESLRDKPSTLYVEETIEKAVKGLASEDYVDNKIGDIDTALENIIAKYGLGGDGV